MDSPTQAQINLYHRLLDEMHDRTFYNAYHRTLEEKESEELLKFHFEEKLKEFPDPIQRLSIFLLEVINETYYNNTYLKDREKRKKLTLSYEGMLEASKETFYIATIKILDELISQAEKDEKK